MDSLFNELSPLDERVAKHELIGLIKFYCQPAFGSLTKRDMDVEIFMMLQRLEVISLKPDIYKVVSMLKITRAKARNLIYESALRRLSEDELRLELQSLLLKPTFLNNAKLLYIEVENPLLQDYIKSILKSHNHITDGSFSSDIIRLSYLAYSALLEDVFEVRESHSMVVLKSYLIHNKMIADTSIKGVIYGFIKSIGQKFAGESGEAVAEKVLDDALGFLQACFSNDLTVTKESIDKMLS